MHIRLLCPAAGVLPHQTLAVVHHRTTARAPLCRAFFFESWKHENHEMNGNGASNAAQQHTPVTFSIDGRLPRPTPLGTVVNDAVHRWFLDTQREAFRGDVVWRGLCGDVVVAGPDFLCSHVCTNTHTEAAGTVGADAH